MERSSGWGGRLGEKGDERGKKNPDHKGDRDFLLKIKKLVRKLTAYYIFTVF